MDKFYLDELNLDKYFIKLIPDFSVFDIAEKDCIDNGENNKLFFYAPNGINVKTDTNFYRAIFKIVNKNEKLNLESTNDFIYQEYIINGDLYIIIISRGDKTIELNNIEEKIIGVAF